jgi:hypothetical protein
MATILIRPRVWIIIWIVFALCISACLPNQFSESANISSQENTATPDELILPDGYLVNDEEEDYAVRVYIAESRIQYVDLRDNGTLRCFLGGPINILPDNSFSKTVEYDAGAASIMGTFYSANLASISYDFGKGYCQEYSAENNKFVNLDRNITGETNIKPETFKEFVE